MSFMQANLHLLDPASAKKQFRCDSYFVDMNTDPGNVVNLTRYWYGLFSHRRGGLWKGLLQVNLSLTQDDHDAYLMVGP